MYENNILDIQKAQKGDQGAMTNLINNNKGLIWNIVKRFTNRGYETEDIYQIGCMGFLKAIKTFGYFSLFSYFIVSFHGVEPP